MPQIFIRTDNKTFHQNRNKEISWILRKLANQIERGDEPRVLYDHVGNEVGTYRSRSKNKTPRKQC